MQSMQLFLVALAFTATATRDDVGRAEATAVPVVKSLMKFLGETRTSDRDLQKNFASWCSSAATDQAKLVDESARRVADAERKLEQMSDDAARVEATRKLISTASNATSAQRDVAKTAMDTMQQQVKDETDFLVRAQDLSAHALHLATLSANPEAGAEGGLESESDGVVALLSQLVHEASAQRDEVEKEKDSLGNVLANFTLVQSNAGSVLNEESSEIESEKRGRVRTTARLSSELADLKRVVTASRIAQNKTNEICANQVNTDSDEKTNAADDWAVRSALDQLVPAAEPAPLAFLQVRSGVQARTSRAARFAAGLMQMSHHHENPKLEKAAEELDHRDIELSVSTGQAKAAAKGKDDALSEIAAFGEGDTGDATTAVAKGAYTGMRDSLQADLAKTKAEQDRCNQAESSTAKGETLVEKTAARNEAMLKVATALTTEREEDASFLESAVARSLAAQVSLKTIKEEEKTWYDKVEDYSKSAPEQLYGVATDITAAGAPQVGSSLEGLVTMLQKRTGNFEKGHSNFMIATAALEKTMATLDRALNIAEAHTKRRARDQEAEKTYRASMATSAEQGKAAVNAARSDSASCADLAAGLEQKRVSFQNQLEQLDSLWNHVQTEPDFA